MELVVFLSCFHSFQEEAKHHQTALRLIWRRLWLCQDLLALGLEVLGLVQGIPDALVFTIYTKDTGEPITVTIVPAYRALGKRRGNPPMHTPALPERLGTASPLVCGHMQTPVFIYSTHVWC